jgi:ABC-type nitrate/sulfonate/bicarbonate transport system substrate-binding protein
LNGYGASTDLITKDRALVRDLATAMIEANRIIYRDPDKVIPIMVAATQKPPEAVRYAWEQLTKNCIWSVNEGFDRARTQWTIDNDVTHGDIDAAKKPSVDDVIDEKLAGEAVAAAGGRVTIGNCKD